MVAENKVKAQQSWGLGFAELGKTLNHKKACLGKLSQAKLHTCQGGRRMIVSTDTDSNWLPLFRNLSSSFHQVLLVPVYQDGGTCGGYPGDRRTVLPLEELEFAGDISMGLTSNQGIHCPRRSRQAGQEDCD